MPELPEVYTIVSQLNRKLKGLVLESVEYDWPKKFDWGRRPGGSSGPEGKFSIKDLKGAKVVGVDRRGKVVLINLERNSGHAVSFRGSTPKAQSKPSGVEPPPDRISILIHLKLTGQLIYQDAKTRIAGGHPIPPLNLPVPNKTTRVTFSFTDPSTSSGPMAGYLYFNDIRKFGWVKIVENDDAKIKEAIGAELGPDPLEMSFEEFKKRLEVRGQSRIKKLLMDQNFVSGIGNIYSDEALWRAKIHPARLVSSLESLEIRKLYDGIRDSLKLAIEKGGSSASAYVDSGGEKGLYLSYAKAYHMTGRPCERCKTPIVRKKMDGRSAHFCPKCQKLP